MDFYEISKSFQQVWENRPGLLVLLILGFVVFVFLVIDTWRHKKRHDKPHR
jgi:hypothetical protein